MPKQKRNYLDGLTDYEIGLVKTGKVCINQLESLIEKIDIEPDDIRIMRIEYKINRINEDINDLLDPDFSPHSSAW